MSPFILVEANGRRAVATQAEVDEAVRAGTVIDVEPTTYHALWHAVPWDSGFRAGPYMETDGAQNITGYNAWQEAEHVR